MIRVWFNHWFSTVYHLINLIKDDDKNEYYIIGSNQNDYSAYCSACDEWYVEPNNLSDEGYVDYCLNFCIEHKIDVFVPRKGLNTIVKYYDKFSEKGIKIFADNNYDILNILDDKYQTYLYFKKIIPQIIPRIRIAKDITSFLTSVEELFYLGYRVCYKLVQDEGARSFRVIDDDIESLTGLYSKPGSKITLLAAIKVLKNYDFKIPILIMPYLDGVEISVDCMKTPTGNIILPRYKTNKRYSEIIFDSQIIENTNLIMNNLNLTMPMNVQYKVSNGVPYLLEINPRMSGGLQLSCKASLLNLPKIAMNKVLGHDLEWKIEGKNAQKVVHIETPICLN